jgi:hypothetical protein
MSNAAVRQRRKEKAMKLRNGMIVMGVAGAVALTAISPTLAGPASTGSAAMKQAPLTDVSAQRWYRHHHNGGAAAAGFAAGTVLGLGLGAAASRPYYYDSYAYEPAYTYSPGYVYDSYAYEPAYVYDYGYSRRRAGSISPGSTAYTPNPNY